MGVILLECCLWGGVSGFMLRPSPALAPAEPSTTMWLQQQGSSRSTEDGWWNEEKRTFYNSEDTRMARRNYAKLVARTTPISYSPSSKSTLRGQSSDDSSVTKPPPASTTEEGWWNEEKITDYSTENRNRKYAPYKISNMEAHRAPGNSANTQNGRPRSFLAPELISTEQKASPYLPASHSSTESPKAEQKESPYKPALYTTPNETIQMEDSPSDVPVPLKTTEGGWWNEEKRDHFRPKHKHTPYTIRNPELHRAPAPSSNAASSSNTEQGWWNEENKVSYSSDPMNRKYVPYQLIPSGSDEATLRLET
jgi:hypothetical protein